MPNLIEVASRIELKRVRLFRVNCQLHGEEKEIVNILPNIQFN